VLFQAEKITTTIMDVKYKNSPVLVIAEGRLSHSVPLCLLQAGHPVTLITTDTDKALNGINEHLKHISKTGAKQFQWDQLNIKSEPDYKTDHRLGIAITSEDVEEKKLVIQQLEKYLFTDSIIAINTESIPLCTLQEACNHPRRLIGMNWAEPAHTTYFLELITNENTDNDLAAELVGLAKTYWNKDPYLVSNDVSIRAKLFGAMVREAFYLVQNGYASIEDIDRACRNDPGYYLPFSGNFRYMDLMGTYAYGLVMKDLNRELSRERSLPAFFNELVEQGGLGMENQKGFYQYGEGDAERWKELFNKFSYRIQEIINKYPFNYQEQPSMADHKTSSL
jgi:3-hydroxybutyryl-CoA dehydrogenase